MPATDRRTVTLAAARWRTRHAVGWLLLVAVALIPLLALADAARSGELHSAPVAVVAPAVVGTALATEADDLEGTPFDATAVEDAEEAVAGVRRGRFVAAYLLELPGSRDRLVLHAGRFEQLNDALIGQVRVLASARGRQLEVEHVDAGTEATVRAAGGLTFTATLLGYAVVVAIVVVRGPVARTFALALARIGWLLGLGLLAGTSVTVLGGVPGSGWRTALVLSAGFWLAALVTYALEAVAGIPGIAVAAALFVALETPLLLETDPVLLPEPWRSVSDWTPVGGTMHALTSELVFDGEGLWRALSVPGAWSAVAVLAILGALRGRATDPAAVVGTGSEALVRRWRFRVGATVLPVAVGLLGLVAVLPRDLGPVPTSRLSPATESRCLETGPVEDLDDLNRVAEQLPAGRRSAAVTWGRRRLCRTAAGCLSSATPCAVSARRGASCATRCCCSTTSACTPSSPREAGR